MHVKPAPFLTCPIDGSPLAARGAALVCPTGHTFDRAKEGYVNLLPVQDKASRDPGDSKEMVAARRHLLATGAYEAIATAMAHAVMSDLATRSVDRAVTILDAGSGEGYYLDALAKLLSAETTSRNIYLAGVDISKWAVRAAAKRATPATWVVASSRRLPFPIGSIDLILCLFGFPIWEGFGTVQPLGGTVLMIDPGPDHLIELRKIIYPELRRNQRPPFVSVPGYHPGTEQTLTSRAQLASPAIIADLLSMTPHVHRASADGRARLAAYSRLDITLDVTLRTYIRHA
jgi:23S rRNA (guanine745-N1)-methyltransferase